MPLIEPDLSSVKEFTAWDAGVYPATIQTIDFKTSKSSGNPMLEITFEVTGPEDATRRMKAWLVITGEGAYGFDSLLRACGFEEYADALRGGSKEPFDSDNLVGLSLNVQVEQEAYNGRLQNKITGYLKA